jgi:hypothetical protein
MSTVSLGGFNVDAITKSFQPEWDTMEQDAYTIINQSLSLVNQLLGLLGTIEDPTITVPAMEDFTAPTDTLYSSALESQVAAKVADEIENGVYGLEPQDEADLWNRERDREQVNAQAGTEEVKRQFAVSGFPVPPGVLNKAIERTVEASAQKISSVNRDISLKRADLYWQGKQFAWTKALEIENMMSKLYDALQTRSLEAAKTRASVSIQKAQVVLQAAIEAAKLLHGKGVAFVEAHARLAASAIAMMNLNVSLGAHVSANENLGASVSTSISESESVSASVETRININQGG